MNPFTFILELLKALPPAVSATKRLIREDKKTDPPPKMTGDALLYMQGRVDGQHDALRAQLRRQRLAELRKSIDGEPEEPEEPTHEP